jgi:hypothetical protein
MISLKRQCPSLSNTIVIDSDSEEQPQDKKTKKKLKSSSGVITNPSPYEAIPEVPNIRLTVEQMKSDPLGLIRQL